jgi:hypothetical protein
VDREYDIFEVSIDGTLIWRDTAKGGHADAVPKLHALAERTKNEARMMHRPTKTVIASLNAPQSSAQ